MSDENKVLSLNGTTEVRNQIKSLKCCNRINYSLLCLLSLMTFYLVYENKVNDLYSKALVLSVLIIIFLISLINRKRLNELSNDLFDYLDMEDILNMKDSPYDTKGNDIKVQDFRQEMWNNINRRGEKSKIALLNNIESKVKSWLEVIPKK